MIVYHSEEALYYPRADILLVDVVVVPLNVVHECS